MDEDWNQNAARVAIKEQQMQKAVQRVFRAFQPHDTIQKHKITPN